MCHYVIIYSINYEYYPFRYIDTATWHVDDWICLLLHKTVSSYFAGCVNLPGLKVDTPKTAASICMLFFDFLLFTDDASSIEIIYNIIRVF